MADSDNNHKLLARKDRGIHTPADLKGKAIGVTKGTSGQFFLEMFLLTQGINPAEVETVDLAMGALTPAVVEGRVDAIATWEPYIFHAQRLLGAKAFLFDTHNTVRTKFYLVATRQFITQRPGALQKFLHAMRRAEVFIQEHNKVGDCLTPQLLELTVSALIPWDPCAAMSTSHTWAVAAQAARRDNALYGVRPAGPSKVDSLTKRSCQIICTSSPSTAYRVPSPRQSPWYHRGTNR